jgi:hypothetical protein
MTMMKAQNCWEAIAKIGQPLENILAINKQYDRAGWCSGNTLDSHSGGARFESQPGHRLSLLGPFAVFRNPLRKMMG